MNEAEKRLLQDYGEALMLLIECGAVLRSVENVDDLAERVDAFLESKQPKVGVVQK